MRTAAVWIVLLLAAACFADDWPLPYHDSANTAISTETIRLPLRLSWKIKNPDSQVRLAGQMVAADGCLYLAGGRGVRAVGLRSGATLWSTPGSWAEICVHGATLVAAGYDGTTLRVAAFDAATGRELWRTEVADDRPGVSDELWVAGHNGRLYVGESRLTELDPKTGAAKGHLELEPWSMGRPAFWDDQVYLGWGHFGQIVDLSTMTGRMFGLWDPGNANPIFWHDLIYVQGPMNRAQALTEGEARYAFRLYGDKRAGHGIAPVGDGLLLEKDEETGAYLAAFDARTGERRWRSPMIVQSMTSATQDLVFVVGEHRVRDRKGKPRPDAYSLALHVLDAKTGKSLWQYRFPDGTRAIEGTMPIIAEGHVVVATSRGVYCFEGR